MAVVITTGNGGTDNTIVNAEKCACPLAAEGDSPIFAANSAFLRGRTIAAAKIGTVPVNGYDASESGFPLIGASLVTGRRTSSIIRAPQRRAILPP